MNRMRRLAIHPSSFILHPFFWPLIKYIRHCARIQSPKKRVESPRVKLFRLAKPMGILA